MHCKQSFTIQLSGVYLSISRLLNYCGQTCYSVTLIHSVQALMSAAMVTNEANQLQAAAHLVGTDQLPMPESVSNLSWYNIRRKLRHAKNLKFSSKNSVTKKV